MGRKKHFGSDNMKKRRRGICALSLFIIGLTAPAALSGCAKVPDGRDEHTPRIFGATYMTRNNPYFDIVHESISEVVEGNGDILISRDPQQDQKKQNDQILEMIDEGIEILFLNPVDWEAVKPALIACHEAGVPVFNIDTSVKDTEYVVTTIETDNYQAGVICAEDMMQRVPSAKILILDNPIQMSITYRVQGFLDTIAGHEEYEVVHQEAGAGELEVSAKVTSAFLEQEIPFDVVLGGNDPTALGALAALQQHHSEEGVLIYGIDGSPDFKSMLDIEYVTGTSMQSPKGIGQKAAEEAYRYLNGETVEPYISIEPVLITSENLSEFEINGWQ
ncbi:MAG: sugar ABC transporter substrate-binding protein [Lachnospiraceae bacterium]|nr:sugar ABC transporter substrate-binding protein [Lachnospiraceae bacterium]